MAECHEHGEIRIRWAPRPDGLEESVQFEPGYNCPVPGGKGHGVHGMQITWLLKGPLAAVELSVSTDWIPGELRPGHGLSPLGYRLQQNLHGWGIGYHTRHPQYGGHTPSRNCELAGGVPCYYDRHLSGADPVIPEFVRRGEQAVWDVLEAEYARITAGAQAAP